MSIINYIKHLNQFIGSIIFKLSNFQSIHLHLKSKIILKTTITAFSRWFCFGFSPPREGFSNKKTKTTPPDTASAAIWEMDRPGMRTKHQIIPAEAAFPGTFWERCFEGKHHKSGVLRINMAQVSDVFFCERHFIRCRFVMICTVKFISSIAVAPQWARS